MWKWYKALPPKVKLPLLLAILVAELVFLWWMNGLIQKRELQYDQYKVKHHCERTGFAGKHAEPTYKCDTGLWLEYEVKREANK